MQYRCRYFKITEIVSPALLKELGEALCWTLFDPQILKAADYIRELEGPITVNAYGLTDAGARALSTTTGAKYSAHKMFRALDLHVLAIEKQATKGKASGEAKTMKIKLYDELRLKLLSDKNIGYLNYENAISWLHIDTYNRNVRIFNP